MPKITLDDIEFNSEDLSENSKKILTSLQFAEMKIKQLTDEIAVLSTAKNSYDAQIREKLKKTSNH